MLLSDKLFKLTPKQKEAMDTLNLQDSDSLLSYYPFRYEILNVSPYTDWKLKDKVTLEGKVITQAKSWRFGKNRTGTKFEVMSQDNIFAITLFNRPWADKQIHLEDTITINGIYEGNNKITATNYQMHSLSEIPTITPVYATKGDIKQKTIRTCIEKCLKGLHGKIQTIIPSTYINNYKLLSREDALNKIHFPNTNNDIIQAYRTLKYEEFLRFFVTVQLLRNENTNVISKEAKKINHEKVKEVISSMPFTPTVDQEKAIEDILKDMESTKVMYRLVQGDVGCGKTFVAMMSAYACSISGYQVAILAPTEILARQHYASFEVLKKYGIRIEVLYSALKEKEKKEILERLKNHKIDILVGTHSILEKNVIFDKLGLVIVDEQQRFGVEQRKALKEKGIASDFLLMSATPIPRTLASTLYGDMDISTIETLPAGRKEVITKLIEENSFRSVLSDVNQLLSSGRQLYVICAAIEKNEDYHARNVIDTANALTIQFPKYEVGILHGKMTPQEKEDVMNAFKENRIQILVSTTVVEVGVNVVNATGMIIYDADKFGLSQLHQLRGRIQRGSERGYCWLLTDSQEEKVKERLEVLVRSNDGFEISSEDLRLRGPGDILGTRQSGLPDFILGNVVEDTKIMTTAKSDAQHIMLDLENPEYSAIVEYASKAGSSYTD